MMADPVDLQALKQKAVRVFATARDDLRSAGQFSVGAEEDARDDAEYQAISDVEQQVLSLVEALTRYRQWLVKERDEAALMGEQPAKVALDDALDQFDAAVRLETPEGEQP